MVSHEWSFLKIYQESFGKSLIDRFVLRQKLWISKRQWTCIWTSTWSFLLFWFLEGLKCAIPSSALVVLTPVMTRFRKWELFSIDSKKLRHLSFLMSFWSCEKLFGTTYVQIIHWSEYHERWCESNSILLRPFWPTIRTSKILDSADISIGFWKTWPFDKTLSVSLLKLYKSFRCIVPKSEAKLDIEPLLEIDVTYF